MSEKIDIYENISFDDSISKYEYHTYQPRSEQFNNNDEIRIAIQHQDVYTLPSESFLYISGLIEVPELATIELVTNAFAFLFDEIRYEINGVEIDKSRDVGITSLIKGYLSFTRQSKYLLETAGWCDKGAHPTYNSVNKTFYVEIPLKHLLGFAEDYKKIVTNVKQELILLRSRSDLDCFVGNKKTIIKLTKVEWRVPHIQVNDEIKLSILNRIKSDKPVLIPFRKWEIHELPALRTTDKDVWTVKTSTALEKPRYVILAFHTNRRDKENADVSQFDHCNIRNIKVFLNSESYPYDNLNLDIEKSNWLVAYRMYALFQESYYNTPNSPALDLKSFKDPMMFVFDVSKQNESIKSSTVDLKVEFEASTAFEANTRAYCLILCDTIAEYTPLTGLVRKLVN